MQSFSNKLATKACIALAGASLLTSGCKSTFKVQSESFSADGKTSTGKSEIAQVTTHQGLLTGTKVEFTNLSHAVQVENLKESIREAARAAKLGRATTQALIAELVPGGESDKWVASSVTFDKENFLKGVGRFLADLGKAAAFGRFAAEFDGFHGDTINNSSSSKATGGAGGQGGQGGSAGVNITNGSSGNSCGCGGN